MSLKFTDGVRFQNGANDMRLVDIDDIARSNVTGKTAILNFLDKWEKDHPLKEIHIQEDDGWEITMQKK